MSAFDAFLEIDGIADEAIDAKHGKTIEILSYSFGATQIGAFGSGSGGGAGKVQFQDFHFTKRTTESSPPLFLACCNGKHIAKAQLYVRKATGDGGQEDFAIFHFTDLLVSSFTVSGQGSGDPIPTESISFNFTGLKIEYKKQDAKGQLKPAGDAGWDVKKNAKL